MQNKIQIMSEIYEKMLYKIAETPENWMAFLNSATWNFGYNFSEKVCIFMQRPEAKACATIEQWNNGAKRWINKNAKGIAILDSKDGNVNIKYVFDASDTHQYHMREYNLWQVRSEHNKSIIQNLEQEYGELETKNNLEEAIYSASFKAVESNINEYVEELKKVISINTKLNNIDDILRKIINNSVTYMALNRCNINPHEYFSENDFQEIELFKTFSAITQIGNSISDIAETELKLIRSTVKEYEKNIINTLEDSNKIVYFNNEVERSDDYGNNIYETGRNNDTRYSTKKQRQSGDTWQVRYDEATILEGIQESFIPGIGNERQANRALNRNRKTGKSSNGASNESINGRATNNRNIERAKSNDVGTNDEQLAITSGGSNNNGANLQLNNTESSKEEVNNTSSFNVTDEMITKTIQTGSLFVNGKFRINKQFEQSFSTNENIKFLKKEYGIGGSSSAYTDSDFSEMHDAKGIRLYKYSKNEKYSVLIPWIDIEKRIKVLVQKNEYLNEDEKLEYKNWLNNESNALEISNIEVPKEQSLEERILEFENEFDIYDKTISNDEYAEENKTIEDIKEALSNSNGIRKKIEYYQEVLNSEDDIESELNQKLIGFISNLSNLLDEKIKNENNEYNSNEVLIENNNQEKINYHIKNESLGNGTPKERYRNNIEAIKILKKCENENRFANEEEQEKLALYVGWGGLSEVFDNNNSSWSNEYLELKSLLNDEEYAKARASTLTAFYTSPLIIKYIYKILENAGFKSGNILEPSCGIGNFIGMLPKQMESSKVYGVELDEVSGNIAQQLYQKSNIQIDGYENVNFKDNFFDVAIGNVPFGEFKLYDERYKKNNFLVHDYFFAKALDKVKPRRNYSIYNIKRNIR